LSFAVETEQEGDAFSSHVTQLVQHLTADTETEQKLIVASETVYVISVCSES